ncbi:alpha/beta hydrolase family protein [Acuticoccus sediminis]|uniref:alpha/beta hydrolase family protein n=1 Tax=Acuticoccus sediminis TaxID=2184697 RepID=UPI001CFF0D17|nr:hypothetical protein [Acuticoccus sediminis]
MRLYAGAPSALALLPAGTTNSRRKLMAVKPALLLWLALAGANPVAAFNETIEIASRDIFDEAFLRGDDSDASVVTLTGRLTGPDRDIPVPVVILLHGTDGPRTGPAGGWRAYFADNGVATLRLDSYTGRGLIC